MFSTLSSSPQGRIAFQGRASTLVAVQPSGSRVPLYLVHDICCEVTCYDALARAIGPDQPLYAFAVTGREQEHPEGMEAIASAYLRDLLAFHPGGPYILGGYSFGGIVAFEMAKQLSEIGKKPCLVIMFDSYLLGIYTKASVREQVSVLWRNSKVGGFEYLLSKVRLKMRYWRDTTAKRVLSAIGSLCRRLGCAHIPRSVRKVQTEIAYFRAIYAYHPTNYAGQVVLISCVNPFHVLSRREDPFLGWGKRDSSSFELWPIPSDHGSLMREPIIWSVAQRLQEKISSLGIEQGLPPRSVTPASYVEVQYFEAV